MQIKMVPVPHIQEKPSENTVASGNLASKKTFFLDLTLYNNRVSQRGKYQLSQFRTLWRSKSFNHLNSSTSEPNIQHYCINRWKYRPPQPWLYLTTGSWFITQAFSFQCWSTNNNREHNASSAPINVLVCVVLEEQPVLKPLLRVKHGANMRRCHFTVQWFLGAGKGSALLPVAVGDAQLLQWSLSFLRR